MKRSAYLDTNPQQAAEMFVFHKNNVYKVLDTAEASKIILSCQQDQRQCKRTGGKYRKNSWFKTIPDLKEE